MAVGLLVGVPSLAASGKGEAVSLFFFFIGSAAIGGKIGEWVVWT